MVFPSAFGSAITPTSATVLVGEEGGTVGRFTGNALALALLKDVQGGIVTVSTPVIKTTQAWNDGAVVFTGWQQNITNTASAAGSMLADLKLDGLSVFRAKKEKIWEMYNLHLNETDYERLALKWDANVAKLITEKGGSGVRRELYVYAHRIVHPVDDPWTRLDFQTGKTVSLLVWNASMFSCFNDGGTNSFVRLQPGNQITLQADWNAGGNAARRIGFYGVTPTIQPATVGETVGFVAGAGTAVLDDSTFTGNVGTAAYRISDVVKALKNLGLLAA